MTVRRTTLTITGAQKHGARWAVTGENHRGRVFKFSTTRGDFSKGQRVTVTHHTIRRDGTLVGARFSKLENIRVNRKQIVGKQARTRSRSFRRLLALILSDFRDGLGDWKVGTRCRSGVIKLEGFEIRVDSDKLSWFQTPDGVHHVWGSQVASWIEAQIGGI